MVIASEKKFNATEIGEICILLSARFAKRISTFYHFKFDGENDEHASVEAKSKELVGLRLQEISPGEVQWISYFTMRAQSLKGIIFISFYHFELFFTIVLSFS